MPGPITNVSNNFSSKNSSARPHLTAPPPNTGPLKRAPALRYLHRPSNLEDVFLKLTGRDLRD